MRINDLGGLPGAQPVDRVPGGAEKATNRPTAESGDRADVSPVADLAQSADPQRLEVLRAAVESGQYRVSADALARSIVDAHLKP